ncbi:GNAT family N-acetyltransferase [Sphingomonas elodea]|uniref:GNAT family N-acetyltransferase n=1 Tax=Sphingomonas elodea TaxID=179878 RepID=UPI000263130A|nr:GNAT family N-acetyltransferase [Sphingomonas elodea]
MIYRDATPADAAVLHALYRESFVATFGHLYAPEDLARFFAPLTLEARIAELEDPHCAFRIVEDAHGAAGYCKVGPLHLPAATKGPALELDELYLLDRAKGSGAAQTLMDWAIATARARGAAELWLSVYVDNHRAKRFYARNGFEDRGPYAFMVGNHADEDRLMRRAL